MRKGAKATANASVIVAVNGDRVSVVMQDNEGVQFGGRSHNSAAPSADKRWWLTKVIPNIADPAIAIETCFPEAECRDTRGYREGVWTRYERGRVLSVVMIGHLDGLGETSDSSNRAHIQVDTFAAKCLCSPIYIDSLKGVGVRCARGDSSEQAQGRVRYRSYRKEVRPDE